MGRSSQTSPVPMHFVGVILLMSRALWLYEDLRRGLETSALAICSTGVDWIAPLD